MNQQLLQSFLCGCSSVIAGDDILPVGRIISEFSVATAWQPIQAPAVAVPCATGGAAAADGCHVDFQWHRGRLFIESRAASRV